MTVAATRTTRRTGDHGGMPSVPRPPGEGPLTGVLDEQPLTAGVHWLLPIDPAAHAGHLPDDWRARTDATAVWEAIGRSQPIGRWCLRTGFRAMRPGETIWAYLSRRQEVCAVGVVRALDEEDGAWFVQIVWDGERTAALCRDPLPRATFGQVPMSVCRAGAHAAAVLARRYDEAAPA